LASKDRDGFFVEPEAVYGRIYGREFRLALSAGRCEYSGPGFLVRFCSSDPEGTITGEASGEVDLVYFHIMDCFRRALYAPGAVNYVNC
jgi:hypothetical protein